MTIGRVDVEVAPEAVDLARSAARWAAASHPHVAANADGARVMITSPVHDRVALTRIWRTALLNERLHRRAEADRADVLSDLLR